MTYRSYISDLDGTLYRGEKVIPGAPQTSRIEAAGLR